MCYAAVNDEYNRKTNSLAGLLEFTLFIPHYFQLNEVS